MLKVFRAAVAVAVAVSAWAGVAALAAAPTIAEVAPEDSLLVAGVDDFAALKATIDRSPYGALWEDPEFKEYLRGIIGDTLEAPRRALSDMGIDVDTFKPPAGSTGLAAFFRKPAGVKTGRSAWAGINGLIYADFLDDAASSDAVWSALERLADRVVKDGFARKSEVEHGGVFITVVEINYEEIDRRANERQDKAREAARAERAGGGGEAEGAGADPDAMEEDEAYWEAPSTLATSGLPPAVHMARVKGVIAACSHLETLKEALDRFGGEPSRSKTVADAPVFSAAMGQHGKAALAAPHVYAALLTASASDFFVRFVSGGGEPENADADADLIGPMGRADWAAVFAGLGLDKVQAVSVVSRFDTQDAGMEQSIAILVPEKRGLVALFDVPEQAFAAPSVAPADATGVLVQHVKFAEVPALVRGVVAGLPESSRTRGQGFLDFAMPQIEPLLTAMGTELVMTKRIERPFTGKSEQTTWAVRIADQAKFVSALSTFTANFGLEPRDFLGNQVWGAPMGGMTIGVGAGRVILGEAASVEGALREASEPGRPRLTEEAGFKSALRAIGGSGLGYYYQQARAPMEYASWRAANIDRIIAEQFEGFEGDPEEVRRYSEMVKASMPAWSKRAMPVGAILRAMGDDIMELRSTPEGFVSRSLTLRPEAR